MKAQNETSGNHLVDKVVVNLKTEHAWLWVLGSLRMHKLLLSPCSLYFMGLKEYFIKCSSQILIFGNYKQVLHFFVFEWEVSPGWIVLIVSKTVRITWSYFIFIFLCAYSSVSHNLHGCQFMNKLNRDVYVQFHLYFYVKALIYLYTYAFT